MVVVNLSALTINVNAQNTGEKVKLEWESTSNPEKKPYKHSCRMGTKDQAKTCGREDANFVLAKGQSIEIKVDKSPDKICGFFVIYDAKKGTNSAGLIAANQVCTDGKKIHIWKNDTGKNIAIILTISNPTEDTSLDNSPMFGTIYFPK